jgi:putative NADH-flavin reductase
MFEATCGAFAQTNTMKLRLVEIGGAGTLEVAPSVQLLDTANFPEA